MEPYILILGGEFALRERVLAGAIRASGGKPVLTTSKTPMNPAIKFFDDVIFADVMIPEAVVAAVKRYQEKTGAAPLAVIPMNDFVVRTGLAVANAFGLRYNSAATVDACRDKYLMKEILSAAGVPVPKFGKFKNADEMEVLLRDFKFPIVIKPGELAGSVGVIKVDTPEQAKSAYAQCLKDIAALGGAFNTREDEFVAEEYIETIQEVSVEVICHEDTQHVIAVTDKYLGSEPYFVETGHSVPSVHNDNPLVRSMAEKACAALGIRYGVAHAEMRIMPNGEVRLIEVGARTGGDCIMDLVSRAFGVNPYYLHVQSYLGITPKLPEAMKPRGLAAVAFLKADQGIIEKVTLPKTMGEEVVNLQVTAKPMDKSEAPLSWKFREGSMEFFWPGQKAEVGFRKHLDGAKTLSQSLFTLMPLPTKRALSALRLFL